MKILSILSFLLFLTSFSLFAQHPEKAQTERIERITQEEFKNALESGDYVLLDVRTVEEYESGHIEGAKSLDVTSAVFQRGIDQISKDYKYLIYCQSGERSATALKKMKEAGFKHVLELEGGYSQW